MRQYKIFFYYKRSTQNPAVYYREFGTLGELVLWGNAILQDCPLYDYFKIERVSLATFLKSSI